MMNYLTNLIQEYVLFSGDVQTTTIAMAISGSLFCSILWLVVSLLQGSNPDNSRQPGSKTHYKNSVAAFHIGRHLRRTHTQKTFTSSQPCRQLEKNCNIPCISCNMRNADKACRFIMCAECCQANKATVCSLHGSGQRAAQGLVEGACEDKPVEIDLSYLHLKSCPNRVGFIGGQLTTLNLSNNRLEILPEEIGFLLGLEELFLQYNCLTTLPESVGNLTKLHELDLKNNCLIKLPESIGSLNRLTFLRVTNNALQSLPASLGKLQKLEEISAHSNQLTELPDEVCHLMRLGALYLGENRLWRLPNNMGNLVKLAELDVSGCELEVLPNSLARCTGLIRLWLSGNRLKSLPDQIGRLHQLKELHLKNNQIRFFPASLACLQLYTFSATQNPLIEEWDSAKLRGARKSPPVCLPPLVELTARVVAKQKLQWKPDDLPIHLQEMLQRKRRCSCCEGPLFDYYESSLTFKTVGIFHKVPLYQQICSPYLNNACHPVPLMSTQ